MKTKHTLLALLVSATFTLSCSAETVWRYTFDSLTSGDLIGQDDWKGYTPAPNFTELSPKVVKSPDQSHGLVLAQQSFDGKASSRARKQIPSIYNGRTHLVLECDMRATAANSIAVMGFGSNSAFPATFGIQFDQFVLRAENFDGKTYAAVDTSGRRISPKRGDWYRVRSVWKKDPATGEWTGTLAIRDLTKGEAEFTPLCFDRGQMITSSPLSIDTHRHAYDFDVVVVRLGILGGEIDNLSISPQAP